MFYSFVEGINETNIEYMLVFEAEAKVTNADVSKFCKEAQNKLGKVKIVYDVDPPVKTDVILTIGTKPESQTNTISGFIHSEKLGVCTVSFQRPPGAMWFWYVEIKGKNVLNQEY